MGSAWQRLLEMEVSDGRQGHWRAEIWQHSDPQGGPPAVAFDGKPGGSKQEMILWIKANLNRLVPDWKGWGQGALVRQIDRIPDDLELSTIPIPPEKPDVVVYVIGPERRIGGRTYTLDQIQKMMDQGIDPRD